MYGYDYAYEPATEGLAEIGNWITEKLNAGKEMIKKLIDDVKEKLRRLSGKKENISKNTGEVMQLIAEISSETESIIGDTGKAIKDLKNAYVDYGKLTTDLRTFKDDDARKAYYAELRKKGAGAVDDIEDSNSKTGGRKISYVQYTRGGMKNVRDDLTEAEKKAWQDLQIKHGETFNQQMAAAEKVKVKLKKLSSYGPLGYEETAKGYEDLRKIFGTNQDVISKWQEIKTAVDWTQGSGQIHKSLKKIMSLYDVGLKATEAFGKRLTAGRFRDANGERYKTEDLKEKRAYQKASQGLAKTTKSKFAKDMSGWSDENLQVANSSVGYILDRLYQVAYEDAIQDIDTCNYYQGVYESVPECDAYDYDEDAEYYPDEYYDY